MERFLRLLYIYVHVCAKGVLEDAEDVLINVNLIEAENAAHNIELKKKKTVYDPYENMDVEEV